MNDADQISTDEIVVRKVLAGNKEEFRLLVQRYKHQVLAIVMRQVGNEQVAEELAHETFIKAFSGLKNFRFESKFSSWLIRIAINHTNTYFSSKRFQQMKRTESFNISDHDVSTESKHIDEQKELLLSKFRNALADLKPKYRDVLVLCGLEGRSYEEAASILKIPIGTVRSRLNKARLLAKDAFMSEASGDL